MSVRPPSPSSRRRNLSREQLAEALDLHPDSIKRHHARDVAPPHDRVGTKCLYNAAEYLEWMDAQRLSGERGTPTKSSPELDAARLRKELALAEKNEIAVAALRGSLVDRDAYRAEWMRLVQAARVKLLTIPADIASSLYGQEVPAIERQLRDRVEQAIRELAK